MNNKFSILVLAILLVAVSFWLGRRTHPKEEPISQVDTVTLIRVDTIVREKPVYRYSYIIDTVHTYFTTVEHDSVLVEVPIERKVYEEDSLYRCEISGYRPQLESLTIYPTTTTITIRDTKVEYLNSRISFGIQAGYGVFGKELSPYLGVGISYNLFSINDLKFKK